MSSLQKNLELGREKLGYGDYLGALKCADDAVAMEPSSFEAYQLRGRALYLLGRDAEALQTLRQAHVVLQQMSLAPHPDPSLELDLPDSERTEHSGLSVDALETLLALRERHQLDDELLALLADLAEETERYDIAREAFTELVQLRPNQVDAWEGLVHVLCHEDFDAALQAIDNAIERFSTNPLFYEFLGFIHFRRQNFHLSVIAYRRAIDYGARHVENYQALMEGYLALGEKEAALGYVDTLISLGVNDPDIHRFIVEVALDCENFELAMTHAHQLVRLEPSQAETYCYKAWVELLSGSWPDAERTLRLGFNKAVGGGFSLYELVEVLITDGELDQALRVADLASELAPEHPESFASRGKALREMGAFSDAYDAFRQAADLAPQDDAYQTWMGIVLDNMGHYHEALMQFNRVLSRHPTDVWTLANRGLTYLALDMSDQASADFSQGIEIDAEDGPLYFWRACAQVKLGRNDAALRDLSRAVDLNEEIYLWLDQEVSLAPLHHDPRFLELRARVEREG